MVKDFISAIQMQAAVVVVVKALPCKIELKYYKALQLEGHFYFNPLWVVVVAEEEWLA